MRVTTQKQVLLLEYLISSPDTYALCKSIVKTEYFDPELRRGVEFISDYYSKYHAVPDTDQIFAESSLELHKQEITHDKIAYCSNEVEQFCRQKAMQHAITMASKYIESENYGEVETLVRNALLVSLNRDLGLDYFDHPMDRLEQQRSTPMRITTGYPKLDDELGGGLARKEIVLLSANSGGGKSITLANLAKNLLSQKLNVLYISLELSEETIAQRFDTMFTGIPSILLNDKYKDVANSLIQLSDNMGKLKIKHFASGTNSNALRAYLKEFELQYRFIPDVLIIDYLDILGANESVSMDNISIKDKLASEEYRDILFDYNMYGLTASQQGRSAIEAKELNQGHIAGGITKINTVDVYISIVLNPAMKASGEIGFVFLKTRNSGGEGHTVYLKWDNRSLCILNKPEDETIDDEGVITINQNNKRKSLLDVMECIQ